MRTRKEIEAEIEKKRGELAKLEAELKQYEASGIPERGERYFYADPTNKDFYSWEFWVDEHSDICRFKAGLIRQTEEEAAELGKKMYYSQLFASMSDVTDEDWKDENKPKYFVMWNYQNNTLMYDYWRQYKSQGVAYFSSKDRCREAVESMISDIGDENFKRYVLGISV